MKRNGSSIILVLARKICRVVTTYGTAPIEARYGASFAAAITALCTAFVALDSQDDYLGEIDRTAPEIGNGSAGDTFGGGGTW